MANLEYKTGKVYIPMKVLNISVIPKQGFL